MKTSFSNLLFVSFAALLWSVAEARVGSERRLHGSWMTMNETVIQEQYLSVFCRCCGSEVGIRNVSTSLVPECASFAGESCRCPVREETGNAWWNIFGYDIQGTWNDTCINTILPKANITLSSLPTTNSVNVTDGITVIASTTSKSASP